MLFFWFWGCTADVNDSAEMVEQEQSTSQQGTLLFRFAMDVDYMAEMQEAAEGSFHASIYLGDEVSSIGPEEGAESLANIFVEEVVLPTDGSATDVLLTVPNLPADEVVVLGFLDSDDNADSDDPRPDSKDPVTLPSDNDFDVVGGEETEATIFFGFLSP